MDDVEECRAQVQVDYEKDFRDSDQLFGEVEEADGETHSDDDLIFNLQIADDHLFFTDIVDHAS